MTPTSPLPSSATRTAMGGPCRVYLTAPGADHVHVRPQISPLRHSVSPSPLAALLRPDPSAWSATACWHAFGGRLVTRRRSAHILPQPASNVENQQRQTRLRKDGSN